MREFVLPPLWRRLGQIGLLATGISGIIFALSMPWAPASLGLLAFALIIGANAAFVYMFGSHITPHLVEMLNDFPDDGRSVQTSLNGILGHPAAVPAAIAYAAAIGIGVWLANPTGDPALRAPLSLFLFAANLTVGMGFLAILRFWTVFLIALPKLDLHILNPSRPPLPACLRVNSKVVMITALVASLSLLALVVSGLPLEGAVGLYSAFTLCFVGATYAVPVLPLSNRLKRLKSDALDRVEAQIAAHADALLAGRSASDLPDLARLKDTQAMIKAVQTLPPGGQVSVSAAGIVAFLSFLPTLIDYAKNYFLG